MDVPGISRPVLVALIAAALLVFATGVVWALAWVTHHTDTHTRILPAGPNIDIQDRNADIEVVGSDRSDVRVTTKERRSMFATPHVQVDYAAGRLRLDSHCSGADLVGSGCTVRYRVEVPRAMAVRLVSSSGDVHAKDMVGPLSLRATSGDVHADAPSTDIDVEATSGDIHVHASNPTHVRAHATSGDVHVSVPDRTYAVQTRATSGDTHVEVHEDLRSARKLDASTTSGDVHVSADG
jgi:DUF4097 and DUF4098 domain-containing protein YvlB